MMHEAAVRAAPEARECHNTTGIAEYLVRVEPPDIAAFKSFHAEVLGSLPRTHAITTCLVLDSPKDERG